MELVRIGALREATKLPRNTPEVKYKSTNVDAIKHQTILLDASEIRTTTSFGIAAGCLL